MMELSVVVITKNEERDLPGCLESVAWADEIIVVDDESADGTVAVARRFTDKVMVRRLDAFNRQKQFGVDQARGPWVLSLDADERVSVELAAEIRQVLAQPTSYAGFEIPLKNFFMGRWVRHGNWYLPHLRLFRKDSGRFNDRRVHEKVEVAGEVGRLTNSLLHDSYASMEEYLAKLNLYTTLDAQVLFDAGRRLRGLRLPVAFFLKPAYVLLRKYVLQAAFLDGWVGFLISCMTSVNVLVRSMKLWELTRREGGA